ncbi:uncharacterized protein LOC130760099 [Actinidia eriantha]|uniref:uncharacterized protein LOC130760099 n=1 Tax=Actinidia eriantha TaxID=165200 RepID=UPI00258AF07A|nr:uncharacterized protein LOC130760099 [Actinidia eriantha]
MEDTTWEQKFQALTHILTHPNTTPTLLSKLFISSQIPGYLNWDSTHLFSATPPPPSLPHTSDGLSLSLFLKRVSRFGLPHTSWRSKCPYQQPPPLVLAKGVEEAHWSDEEKKREYVQKRIRRRSVSDVPPLIPFLVPNLLAFTLLLWNPFPQHKS